MKSYRPALLSVLLAALFTLTGCGQSGDLYLPGHNPNPPARLLDNTQAANTMSRPDARAGNEMSTAPDARSTP